ncbi:MAG TPA: GNAT family N-acetyltransferase [Allocoleopsis sp.]
MQIIDLCPDNRAAIHQAATLLLDSFQEHWPNAWPDLDSALAEVQESFGTERISRIAIDEAGNVLGWIGGISQYDGNVWELHPLVVRSDYRGKGVGKALVADLEERVRERGGFTLWVGTDDEDNMTTLAGVNLYPNVFEHIANIKNLRGHPYEFYQKCGFVIVGVLPDANGLGKPDIYMAKSVKKES